MEGLEGLRSFHSRVGEGPHHCRKLWGTVYSNNILLAGTIVLRWMVQGNWTVFGRDRLHCMAGPRDIIFEHSSYTCSQSCTIE